jgi:hypothetical protein
VYLCTCSEFILLLLSLVYNIVATTNCSVILVNGGALAKLVVGMLLDRSVNARNLGLEHLQNQ